MSDMQTITEQAARDARDVFESYGSKAREAIDYMEQLIYAAMRKTEPATDARAEALKEAAAIADDFADKSIVDAAFWRKDGMPKTAVISEQHAKAARLVAVEIRALIGGAE